MTILRWFRYIAITEGISYLVLLLVAMPLKYMADIPQPVTYIGWAHGAVFVTLGILALMVKPILRKKFGWLVKVFIAAIIPFGTFVLDREVQKDIQALSN